jgi:hypothetical protein
LSGGGIVAVKQETTVELASLGHGSYTMVDSTTFLSTQQNTPRVQAAANQPQTEDDEVPSMSLARCEAYVCAHCMTISSRVFTPNEPRHTSSSHLLVTPPRHTSSSHLLVTHTHTHTPPPPRHSRALSIACASPILPFFFSALALRTHANDFVRYIQSVRIIADFYANDRKIDILRSHRTPHTLFFRFLILTYYWILLTTRMLSLSLSLSLSLTLVLILFFRCFMYALV